MILKKINFQYLLSYSGIIPFIFIIIDKYFFFQINEDISINFIIYYLLIIIVFIGSINWNFEKKVENHIIIYGFLPSILSLFIIIMNLYDYDNLNLILLIIIFLLLQLVFDYVLIFSKSVNKNYFYLLRLPLTFLIIISLIFIIF